MGRCQMLREVEPWMLFYVEEAHTQTFMDLCLLTEEITLDAVNESPRDLVEA
jgi:hypothetical protein